MNLRGNRQTKQMSLLDTGGLLNLCNVCKKYINFDILKHA